MTRFLLRIPAYALNGICVALGIAILQIGIGALAGAPAGLAASSAAVCTSLADVVNAPHRTWRRVSLAAVLTGVVGLLIALTRSHPVLLGATTALVAFCSVMTLAWGPRAGAVSFVGILAYVFALGTPASPTLSVLFVHAVWSLLGAVLYLGWAIGTSRLLQPAYRRLALAAALEATARLFRSRAAVLLQERADLAETQPLLARIASDAALEESLQAARDLLFAAPEDDAVARRQTALLLLAIDLRDTLMAGELDLDLLGRDAAGMRVRRALAATLSETAGQLEAIAQAGREARPVGPVAAPGGALAGLHEALELPTEDARARIVPGVLRRAQHMVDDAARMRAAVQDGSQAQPPLSRKELQLFVSVEGWPLAALKPHASLRSPITRHAVRAAVALTSAYVIGLLLPWDSHPHWLVLSVAVVLRGNLEQTLSRRNARVLGTIAGCLVVLTVGAFKASWLANALFLAAVGTAHSFVNQRYLITAGAASVMALLQAHLAQPDSGYPVPERLADTVLGALLAWGFSYVLPSWERRALPRILGRLLKALTTLTRQALRWPSASADVDLRLARREVYEALGGVAGAAQRTRVEPHAVRVPLYAFATLLSHSHALLAHLAAARLMLARRSAELDREQVERELQATVETVLQQLSDTAPPVQLASQSDVLPPEPSTDTPMPWLLRRLQRARDSAAKVAHAAQALRATARL